MAFVKDPGKINNHAIAEEAKKAALNNTRNCKNLLIE
jgi:hypothetical protein